MKEKEPGYAGLQLFTEKCRFVENLITVGFQESSKSFNAKAKEILTAFSTQLETDIVFEGSVKPEEHSPPFMHWLCVVIPDVAKARAKASWDRKRCHAEHVNVRPSQIPALAKATWIQDP